MRPTLFPHAKLVGVAPSLTSVSTTLDDREAQTAASLEATLNAIWPREALSCEAPFVMSQAFIPRTKAIADSAGNGLAHFRSGAARTMFCRLGGEVARRMALGEGA